ncbi:MAG: hypothetical protein ACI4I8_00690, partial [Oscillospiraceae bacterium]
MSVTTVTTVTTAAITNKQYGTEKALPQGGAFLLRIQTNFDLRRLLNKKKRFSMQFGNNRNSAAAFKKAQRLENRRLGGAATNQNGGFVFGVILKEKTHFLPVLC